MQSNSIKPHNLSPRACTLRTVWGVRNALIMGNKSNDGIFFSKTDPDLYNVTSDG